MDARLLEGNTLGVMNRKDMEPQSRRRAMKLQRYLLDLLPVLEWLPRYNWRKQFLWDLLGRLD